jgi:hypothetical protein
VWFAGTLAVLLLVTAGVIYRVRADSLYGKATLRVQLPVPLQEIPIQVDGWVGEEAEIPSTTDTYMKRNFADDYISRHYAHADLGLWANVYVVYCSSHPVGILGHQPTKCFPANGWIHDGTEPSQIVSHSNRVIDCLVHRFHKPSPAYQEVVVANGQITLRERDFSGLGRRANLSGDPALYVAQIQVSSTQEHSVRTAAAQMADLILAFLPDPNGVQAAALDR